MTFHEQQDVSMVSHRYFLPHVAHQVWQNGFFDNKWVYWSPFDDFFHFIESFVFFLKIKCQKTMFEYHTHWLPFDVFFEKKKFWGTREMESYFTHSNPTNKLLWNGFFKSEFRKFECR